MESSLYFIMSFNNSALNVLRTELLLHSINFVHGVRWGETERSASVVPDVPVSDEDECSAVGSMIISTRNGGIYRKSAPVHLSAT